MPADAAPQPRSSEKPGEPALVTAMFSRRLAEPLARLCVRLGIPANAVTVAGGACWLVSLALPPLAGAATLAPRFHAAVPWLWLAAAALWCLGYFLDVVDGSVARLTGTGSTAGFFLDYVFHVLFKPAFLFSVGLGLFPAIVAVENDAPLALPFLLAYLAVLLLSVPANGSQASHAAELALRAECAAGRLRPGEGPAELWLGADAVAAPAAAKRGTPRRTLATLAREVTSYYLQAPLFALAVALDAVPILVRGKPLVPGGLTFFLWFALGALLAIRIPLRCARERRRLGLAPCEPPPPSPAPRPHGPPYPFGRAAGSTPSRLRRAARLFFLRLAWEPLLFLLVCHFFLVIGMPTPDSAVFSDWPLALVLALLPFSAVLLAPAEEVAAAHVFCQTAGKGGAPDPGGAPWRGPLVVPAACLLLLFFVAAVAVYALWLYDAFPAATDAFDCVLAVALVFGLPAVLLTQLILLPWRLARVYRRLRGARGA